MKRKFKEIAALLCICVLTGLMIAGCGQKQEEPEPTTIAPEVLPGEKVNVTMEIAKDENLRIMLRKFDKYTDGGEPGSMEYDYRNEISNRRLLECMFGQRCCIEYSLYPVEQVVDHGDSMSISGESVSWVARNIFHVPSNTIADYERTCSSFDGGSFSGITSVDENGVEWYYSDFTIQKAEFDGVYYYIKYRRNHDDPRTDGTAYQKEYYAVITKEDIDGKEYWTLFTHSSHQYNLIVEDKNLIPDETFAEEIEMLTDSDSNVVMRSGPSKEYDQVTVLAPGILVNAMGTKGEWTYVRYYDHYGWIYSELLSKYQP